MGLKQLFFGIHSRFSDVKAGNHEAKGWPNTAYGVSKLGVTVMTYIQQAEMDKDDREDLVVNSVSFI